MSNHGPLSLRLETKTTAVPGAAYGPGLLGVDDDTGVVEALVSVTGVLDSDGDIIEPGAYGDTLKRRTPKGIFAHDWRKWASKTEAAEEWLPGDPRLPKTTRDGRPWPPEAGALYVKTRYNLKTRSGQEAYENVKFYGPECEWSIGYRVPRGKATRDSKGHRRIKQVDLFEYCPVLFGANNMSATLSVKGTDIDEAAYEPIPGEDVPGEVKDAQVQGEGVPGDPVEPPGGGEEQKAAEEGQGAGEDTPDEGALHADAVASDDFVDAASLVEDVELPEAGEAEDSPGEVDDGATGKGLGEGETQGKAGAPGVADTPSDAAAVARLKRWYLRGEGAARIRWGTPGDFDRCVRIAGKHMDPRRAKGFCANVHKEATGEWPGPRAHGGKKDEGEDEVAESSLFPHLPGSLEELREQIRLHVAKMFGDGVEVVGTWPDHVLISVVDGEGKACSYEASYVLDDDGRLMVGTPEQVALSAGVQDGQDEQGILPFAAMVDRAAGAVKAYVMHAEVDAEAKAGRVLSARNATRLKAAVENLIAVLHAAGIEVGTPEPLEPDPRQPEVTPDSTAPSAREGEMVGKVVLDPGLLARGYRLLAQAADKRLE